MKKTLFISIVALLFSVAALVKVFYPCMQKQDQASAPENVSVAAINVEEILNEKPEIIFNAMQKYQQKMQEQVAAQASELMKSSLNEINNDPTSPFVGPKDAKITLVEFYDYSCGYCHSLFPEMNKIIANNSDVKVVFKPLAFLSQASEVAAKAVLAAAEQGKFVELHAALFTIEGGLDEAKIMDVAGKIGLDTTKLKADMNGENVAKAMEANNALATKVQINGVPTLVLNGEMLQTIDGGLIQDSINELKK